MMQTNSRKTIHIGKYSEDKGTVFFHGVTEYRDNQLEGGSITIAREGNKAIKIDQDTAPAVQDAWNFVNSEFGEPQDQTPMGK